MHKSGEYSYTEGPVTLGLLSLKMERQEKWDIENYGDNRKYKHDVRYLVHMIWLREMFI